jgi:hypothetical protein
LRKALLGLAQVSSPRSRGEIYTGWYGEVRHLSAFWKQPDKTFKQIGQTLPFQPMTLDSHAETIVCIGRHTSV